MSLSGFKRFRQAVIAVLGLLLFCSPVIAGDAKQIILMIADGAGYNVFDATSYYEHGQTGQQVYDDFPVKFGCSTFSYNGSYDPQNAWKDFNYFKRGATDSAAAATAIHTGAKTRNGRICIGPDGAQMQSIAQIASGRGMHTGAVTSVPLTHATPAAVASHNTSRNNYAAIANELIFGSDLDVLIGGGHPLYTPNAKRSPVPVDFRYVGGLTTWKMLTRNKTGKGWSLIQTQAEFQKLAETDDAPSRVIGVAQVYQTLQSDRSGKSMGNLNKGVPTLETITRGALNVLEQNNDGFFLMIEGGAVDWANHDNNLGRMIEEMSDFNRSVEVVVDWIESESSWDETLLIITADHDCGYIWGPGSGKPDTFNPIVNNGKGKLPGAKYHSGGHSNLLVPILAKGAGSEAFAKHVRGTDPRYGKYVDNTDIFRVMKSALPTQANRSVIAEAQK